ncbi:type II secretion system F family protein [Massilia sp. W12]|uniref:type II secretion system F family protein n=1 Tax=Massilia sp. W12 TaxID=3126507 RepID=UPI0030CDA438
MQYEVRALSADNVMSILQIDADNEQDARRQVEARGLMCASVKAQQGRSLLSQTSTGRLPLVLFSQELLALLNAGLSIVEGLEALQEKEANPVIRNIFTRMLQGLREGKRFSQTLSEQAHLFPPLYVGIVKAAEGTSDLPRALGRFIDYQQRVDAVKSKLISAAIYPSILLLVGGGVTFFLIGFVVPRFAEVYKGAGRDLPWMSKLLLEWGQFAGQHSTMLAAIILASLAGIVLLLWHLIESGRMLQLISRLPGLGERLRIYQLSRLYLTLGMLLEGGIPIVPALHTVQGIVPAHIRKQLQAASQVIESGGQISNAFEQHNLSTPVSLRMLRVGERSGEMGQMLTQSAAFYDGEISRMIERFTRSFEPLLMAGIGVVVGAIVVLLYLPIFDLAGSLS